MLLLHNARQGNQNGCVGEDGKQKNAGVTVLFQVSDFIAIEQKQNGYGNYKNEQNNPQNCLLF